MSHERIPENPNDNLTRMESILAGYKRKLAHKIKVRETTQGKIDRLREVMTDDIDMESQEARSRQVIERKYLFDLQKLDEVVEELEGKIIWAEKRQIPFIKSEIQRKAEEAEFEVMEDVDIEDEVEIEEFASEEQAVIG